VTPPLNCGETWSFAAPDPSALSIRCIEEEEKGKQKMSRICKRNKKRERERERERNDVAYLCGISTLTDVFFSKF
jgi:hypothetical protein